jgi:pimeloyl-ACP methyl ester carboxylesterase
LLCLPSHASNSSQWRALMDSLAPRFHVMASDGLGAGKSPPWPSGRAVGLHDEVALLEPLFQAGRGPLLLVGHSYGAAVAVKAALLHPGRVRALALYEPVLFGLLDAESPPPNAGDGIRQAVHAAETALAAGDATAAAGFFIDYWMGPGAWAATPEARRGPIVASIVNAGGWGRATFGEPTTRAQLAQLQLPVLLMSGNASPASAQGVVRLLKATLPQLQTVQFEGLGHMGPITHPDLVNPAIAGFLDTHR